MGLEAGDGLAVEFSVGVNEVVERVTLLFGREAEVTAIGEENAVGIVSTEEIIAPGGIFRGFGSIDGNPAGSVEVELGPAVVAGDITFGFGFGERETDFEARGDARSAHHANEERVEIGAIAALGSAGPNCVAAAPTFAGLVVMHGGNDVVINVARFGKIRGIARSLLLGQLGNHAVQGNKPVGFQVSLKMRIAGRFGFSRSGCWNHLDLVFKTGGDEVDGDVKASSQLSWGGLEESEGIAIFRIAAFGESDGTINAQVFHLLVTVLLRQRQPQEKFGVGILAGGNVHLISKRKLAGGGLRGRAGFGAMRRVRGQEPRKSNEEEKESDGRGSSHGVSDACHAGR